MCVSNLHGWRSADSDFHFAPRYVLPHNCLESICNVSPKVRKSQISIFSPNAVLRSSYESGVHTSTSPNLPLPPLFCEHSDFVKKITSPRFSICAHGWKVFRPSEAEFSSVGQNILEYASRHTYAWVYKVWWNSARFYLVQLSSPSQLLRVYNVCLQPPWWEFG